MVRTDVDIIAIGGSMGSIPVLVQVLEVLPEQLRIPMVIIVHRMKNVNSQLKDVLPVRGPMREPDDKEPITDGVIYIAPANYHLLIEQDRTIGLDYSEPEHYSRPSIDVTFKSAAQVYRERMMGILLSGANKDGAEGIATIVRNGGIGIAQDPSTAVCPVMPRSAIDLSDRVQVHTPEDIANIILNIQRNIG